MRQIIILSCLLVLKAYSGSAQQPCITVDTFRKEVKNTRAEPYKYICQLLVKRQRGSFKATGFLIAPRVILTAGHNIHRFSIFSFPRRITIVPGASYSNLDKAPFGSYQFDHKKLKIITHPNYKGMATRKTDFGIIILPDDSIYNRLGGFLEIEDFDRAKNEMDTLMISGYPGDKDYGTQWTEGTTAFSDSNGMIVYGLYTHTGLSGAPVFYHRKMQDKYFVVGIHNTGNLKGTINCNAATKIDSATEDLITDWVVRYGHITD